MAVGVADTMVQADVAATTVREGEGIMMVREGEGITMAREGEGIMMVQAGVADTMVREEEEITMAREVEVDMMAQEGEVDMTAQEGEVDMTVRLICLVLCLESQTMSRHPDNFSTNPNTLINFSLGPGGGGQQSPELKAAIENARQDRVELANCEPQFKAQCAEACKNSEAEVVRLGGNPSMIGGPSPGGHDGGGPGRGGHQGGNRGRGGHGRDD